MILVYADFGSKDCEIGIWAFRKTDNELLILIASREDLNLRTTGIDDINKFSKVISAGRIESTRCARCPGRGGRRGSGEGQGNQCDRGEQREKISGLSS
ncbi:hypothetical protein [Frankia canadensis]|uniref:hypothetical protein n=1 Tax=Frankia canadensis TaxID=1836972 RepID=UPI0010542C7D|nr:hypothetical protein [Frankia canadensis]